MSYQNATQIPTNIDEFLSLGWDKKIIYRIRKFDLRDVLNSQEEVLQDILLSLMATDYLSRFDPEKHRKFEVYIYVFVDNFLKRRYVKEHTKNGIGIVNRASIETSLPEGEDSFEKGVVYLETLDMMAMDDHMRIQFEEILSEIKEELGQYKASSSVMWNGIEVKRDPITVFNFLLEDRSIAEIAEIFQTSKQFVYNLLKRVRSTNSALALYKELTK